MLFLAPRRPPKHTQDEALGLSLSLSRRYAAYDSMPAAHCDAPLAPATAQRFDAVPLQASPGLARLVELANGRRGWWSDIRHDAYRRSGQAKRTLEAIS
jgi:hypothetical protein